MTRALVAESLVTMRELLVEILRADPEIQLVGEAQNSPQTLQMVKRLKPSVLVMGVGGRGMDGLETTKRIMIESPTPIVIVSGKDMPEVELSVLALRAGALAVVSMPANANVPGFTEAGRRLISTVKAMAQVKVVRRWRDRPRTESAPAMPSRANAVPPRIVAIAASTGGPAALQRVLAELSAGFPAPVLIVQHIAQGFVGGLVAWLNTVCSLKVKLAVDGERLAPHTVYLCPDDHHLGISTRFRITLSTAGPIGGFRPSANFLFETVANAAGASAIAVILTGMGHDGVDGLGAIRKSGGRVIAQDEASSVVFGMPAAAIKAGVVDHVLPLSSIAARLTTILQGD